MDYSQYTFSLEIAVRDYEVDVEGIVNNAEYLHYMEHTRHEFCIKAGISFRQMHENGLDPVATRIEIDYKRPLVMGDVMTSCLNISRKGPIFVFYQDIYTPSGELATKAVVNIACLENGRLSRGDALAAAFDKFLK